jgi:peptidoglycan pentaglycine glycine transferase (the first glycine)
MGAIAETRNLKQEGRVFDVCWSDEPNDPVWDDFVVSTPHGHHEQTSLWGQVRACYGWSIARYSLRENGSIIGGAQVQVKPVGRIGKGAYITYGPCAGTEDPLVSNICIAELKTFLKRLGVMMAVVGLPYDGHGLVAPLGKSGFIRKPTRLDPHFLETTLVIDLTQEHQEILAAMRASTRKNIKSTARKGITVVEGDARDIETFRTLMVALCERRKTPPNPPQADFFHRLWENFNPRGWIKLFIAMFGEEPVSAAIAIPFGDWFRVWKIGWSGQHGTLKPNEAIWWAMIQYARETGHRHFDFVELDPVQIKAMREGRITEPLQGNVTFFKLGFGGEIKELPGAYLYFVNPILRTVVKLGLSRFLDSGAARRLSLMYDKRTSNSGK